MSQPWSKCKACGRDEYNHILLERDRRCRCGREVKLYKPQANKGGASKDSQELQLSVVGSAPQVDKGVKEQEEISLMEKTLTATTDPLLRKLLTD